MNTEFQDNIGTSEPFSEAKEAEKKLLAAKKKRRKITCIVAACAALLIAIAVIITKVIIPSVKYNDAVELMNNKQYEEAVTAFEALGGYKDSTARASDSLYETQKNNLTDINVGDTILFGAYEQDNDTSNGKEEIKWTVLDIVDNKALVISKYALDCQRYNFTYTDVTWESCTLRKWLNDSFLNTAFGSEHQKLIPTVSVSADKNPNYDIDPGNATDDKIFLLSLTEEEKYFTSAAERQCSATSYARAHGTYTGPDDGNCLWWLRSPGDHQFNAILVHTDGAVVDNGFGVDYFLGAVRPVLWIELGE